jgi:hypothetical protein
LINNFIDVFENNLGHLANKFSEGTQDYIKSSAEEEEEKNKDTINVKIEAPVLIIPEKDRMWVADLGTFEIRKDPNGSEATKALTYFEGKQTKMYFTEKKTNIYNLNNMDQNPDLISDTMTNMSLIVSDLGFIVELGKTIVKVTEGPRPGDRKIGSVSLNCRPFKVNLVEHSIKSFCSMIMAFMSVSSRTDNKVKKLKEKGNGITDLEYNLGYDIWEKCEVYLDNFMVIILDSKGKLLMSYYLNELTDMKKEEQEPFKKLVLNFKHKKIELRSTDRKQISELQFKVGSIESVIKEKSGEEGETKAAVTNYSNDLILRMKFKAIDLTVTGYHPEGIAFFIKLGTAVYHNKSIDGAEEGLFSLQKLSISDMKEGSNIISLREEEKSCSYSYNFHEGSLLSEVTIKQIESSYKEQYIRSLLSLVEYLIENLINNEQTESEIQEDSKKQEDVSLKPQATTTYSRRSELKVMIEQCKSSIYYKKDLKCIDLVTRNISVSLITEGSKMILSGRLNDAGVYDLHKYPFKEEDFRAALAARIPMLQMKKGGSVTFDVVIDEKDTLAEVVCKNIVVDWVQQRFMRLIDFIMFQVLEVFYPSLYSFSKYYSRDNVIRFALVLLNDPAFVKQNIKLENVEFNLCSTTNMDQKIGFIIENTTIHNDRVIMNKVINQDEVSYFPFGGLESDIWTIKLQNVKMEIIDEGLLDEMISGLVLPRERHSENFDMLVEVDFLTKLFELSFLYDIVDDFENFDEQTKEKFNHKLLNDTSRIPKVKPTIEELKEQAVHFIGQERKEKLYVNGRYNVRIKSSEVDINFTNRFLNKLYAITSNNIAFDDGKDGLFRNTYVQSTAGIQMFLLADLGQVVVRAKDYKKAGFELFRIDLNQQHFEVNKRSNYINEIAFAAKSLSGKFNPELEIPPQYAEFFSNYDEDVSSSAMQIAKNFLKFGLGVQAVNSTAMVERTHIQGTILMTPDYKKDIQVSIRNPRLIVFTFFTRLFPELMILEPLVEHKGYEDPNFSLINIMVEMENAEICLASNREGCIVLYGNVGYNIKMDDKTSKHLITLSETEIIDCNEQAYLKENARRVTKRTIAKKFDFTFAMNSDIYFNAEYGITADKLLTKLTAYNINTLISVSTFQGEWDQKMVQFTLVDPKSIVVQEYKTTMSCSLAEFSFVYVDNFKHVFLPVIRFDYRLDSFKYGPIENGTRLLSTIQVKGTFNNSRTAKWEPFLESLTFDVELLFKQNSTAIHFGGGLEGSAEGVYLNFSEELLEVILHCFNNASKVVSTNPLNSVEQEFSQPLLSSGFSVNSQSIKTQIQAEEPEATIFDSQFLIRNKSGFDVFIETLGDRKSEKIKVRNQTEKVVNFIILDEFSTKDSTNRDVILTFGADVDICKLFLLRCSNYLWN